MTERWLPVENYPRYEVSDFGNVRNILTGRIMKSSIDKHGYLTIKLYPNRKTFRTHLLVARAFLGPCPVGQECRHWDGNKANPALLNLLYGTRRENRLDAYRHGTCTKNKDIAVGRKTRDTKDAKYGRKYWVSRTLAGEHYSENWYDLCNMQS